MKKKYKMPSVIKQVTVRLESDFLQGSVVNNTTTLETAGHKVEERDLSATEFNHTWQ